MNVDELVSGAGGGTVTTAKKPGHSKAVWFLLVGVAAVGLVAVLVTMLRPPEPAPKEEDVEDDDDDEDDPAVAGKCPAGEFANAKWPTSSAGTVTGPCLTGYAGELKRECGADGKWSNAITSGECVPVCPAVTESHVQWPQTVAGGQASGECPDGYLVNGTAPAGTKSTRVCAGGTWTDIVGPCEKRALKKIDRALNIIVHGGGTYRCGKEYPANSSALIRCPITEDSTWGMHAIDLLNAHAGIKLRVDRFCYDSNNGYKNVICNGKGNVVACHYSEHTCSIVSHVTLPPGVSVTAEYWKEDCKSCTCSVDRQTRSWSNNTDSSQKYNVNPFTDSCLVGKLTFNVVDGWSVA